MSKQLVTMEEARLIMQNTRNELESLYVLMLWHSGGRSTEVASIRLQDINTAKNYIILRNLKQHKTHNGIAKKSKGNEFKEVYINLDIIKELVRFIEESEVKPDKFIFSYSGIIPWNNWTCWYIVTHAATRANVLKTNRYGKLMPAWPHTFRHGSATHQLEISDNNLVFVKEQLGHSNINITEGYITLSESQKQKYASRNDGM